MKLTDLDREVVLAYADCNMCWYATARKLYMANGTADYHLRKVHKLTGLNPKRFYDLVKLVDMMKADQLEQTL